MTSKKDLRRLHEGALRQLATEREERATAEHRITYLQEQLASANESWARSNTAHDATKGRLADVEAQLRTASRTIQRVKDALNPVGTTVPLPSIFPTPFVPGIMPNRLGEPAPQFNFSFDEDKATLDIRVVPNTDTESG